ncbi:6-bladed beta-propeller [Haliscomenobacter hydrossis]|uniref:6-bladed beta-propeller n=1 Tax=Haliscomenobacter hydrossis (strain ATCC 27775 / DSM 1100 / LMG 10767 / O) TaxID=760192 RepID=F4L339_HALH1|nr:6-bladed beta-propeller [Haliscomenobacter hydrossis]AEE50698.1 hypothetical protein Halhy_2832 [Haliscomenobacter hydrossis DSM 1100]
MKNLLILLLCTFFACQDSNNKGKEILIDNTNISNFAAMDSLIERIEVIKLETNLRSIINNNFSKILLNDDYVYWIEYGYEGRITIFNRKTGRFVKQLTPTGEGPEEFSYITDVSMLESNEIELYSNPQRKLIYYSSDGTFARERNVLYNFDKRIYLDNNTLINHYNGPSADYLGQDLDHRLIVLDSNQKITNYYLPFQFKNNTITGSALEFSVHKNGVIIYEPFHPNIHEINDKKIFSLKYNLKFKKNNPDESFLTQHQTIAARHKSALKDDIPMLNLVFENDGFLIFKYNYIKNQSRVAVFDKKKQAFIINTNALVYSKWSWPLIIPASSYKSGLVFSYSAETFISLCDNVLSTAMLDEIKPVRNGLKKSDNPIIMVVKLKDKP